MSKSQLRYMPKSSSREEVSIDSGVATSVLLATERVNGAQTTLALRQLELQVLLTQIRTHFEENGRYVVHEVDPAAMVVRRSARASDDREQVEEPGAAAPSVPGSEPTNGVG